VVTAPTSSVLFDLTSLNVRPADAGVNAPGGVWMCSCGSRARPLKSDDYFWCFPDAVQREMVRRWSGTVAVSAHPDSEFVKVPGLQRTTPLRCVLRRAREMLPVKLPGNRDGRNKFGYDGAAVPIAT
jgi:hypothetical protein